MGRSGSSVTLSWVAPTSDGGGGLRGYRVEMKAAASGEWQLCHGLVPGPECVVAGLAPGETYRFRVAAVGPAGAGEPVYLPQTVKLGEWPTHAGLLLFPLILQTPSATPLPGAQTFPLPRLAHLLTHCSSPNMPPCWTLSPSVHLYTLRSSPCTPSPHMGAPLYSGGLRPLVELCVEPAGL